MTLPSLPIDRSAGAAPVVAPIPKADAADFRGRFREVIADPLNLLIERHPRAGLVEDGWVWTHAGLRVRIEGPGAYYGDFSDLLALNRGVHEPLEELAFQQWLTLAGAAPVMLELGAYWAHYSMWLKSRRPDARVTMVEPETERLAAGQRNFEANGLSGRFLQDFVGRGRFEVDAWMADTDIERLDLLHADVQGWEGEMLEGCARGLAAGRIARLFVSTHSQDLHAQVEATLRRAGYRIELSSDFDLHTSAFDGLVCAAHPAQPALFDAGFTPLSREQIARADAAARLAYVQTVWPLCRQTGAPAAREPAGATAPSR
ncbi:MAG: FkbM family methyltransferase [Burkholderiaceae bacterium]|nr:FkbM family methyltransferase [Burkholderiaceae bacterium]